VGAPAYPGAVPLSLYDTVAGAVRVFVPRVPGEAGIYLCGATVQAPPHIGHLRSAVAFDVLGRWLEHTGHRVTFIRNVTDIDDKILARAAETGRAWWSIAYDNELAFNAGYDALNVRRPTYEPRATGHVPEMVVLIGELIDGGHAYPAADGSGDVYFDVLSWADYGELSHQRVQDMRPAEDADPRGKRDSRDFALWKGHKPGEPTTASWATPWGVGRPGWHLECSAMARKYLGSAFDIHAGGIDLRFPHHENEQAQSRAAKDDFAAYWLHNGWVTTGGEKISKSLGNSIGLDEVLARVRPAELRYYLGSAHYRSMIEFSEQTLDDAAAAYRRIEDFLTRAAAAVGADPLGAERALATDRDVARAAGGAADTGGAAGTGGTAATTGPATGNAEAVPTASAPGAAVPAAFAAALDDDLGVPQALAVLHETVHAGNRALAGSDTAQVARARAHVEVMAGVLGLSPSGFAGPTAAGPTARALRSLVEDQVRVRAWARAERDFATADAVRDRLDAAGVLLADGTDGTTWSLAPGSTGTPGSTGSPGAPDSTGQSGSAGRGHPTDRGVASAPAAPRGRRRG